MEVKINTNNPKNHTLNSQARINTNTSENHTLKILNSQPQVRISHLMTDEGISAAKGFVPAEASFSVVASFFANWADDEGMNDYFLLESTHFCNVYKRWLSLAACGGLTIARDGTRRKKKEDQRGERSSVAVEWSMVKEKKITHYIYIYIYIYI